MGLIGALMGNAGQADELALRKKYGNLLLDDETIEMGFKLIRDVYIFTDKRLILIDKQGLTGKKVDMLSLPYRSISRFSLETSGHFDLDAELKIWVSSSPEPTVPRPSTARWTSMPCSVCWPATYWAERHARTPE